ncbi:hypothetical protein MKS88_005214 [Plasmodium brasilianum]|nr:hypothetical protein MKS88_005214 [Plasmodium brasilianum]
MKHFDEENNNIKSRGNECNRNNALNIRFSRLLNGETKIPGNQQYQTIKKGIYSMLYESDDTFRERLKALEHDDEFKKRFNNLVQCDFSEQEFNDLRNHKNFQKKKGASKDENDVKKKGYTLKNYDDIEKYENANFLKSVDSSIKSDLFQIGLNNNYYFFKIRNKVKYIFRYMKEHKVYSAFVILITVIASYLVLSLFIMICKAYISMNAASAILMP